MRVLRFVSAHINAVYEGLLAVCVAGAIAWNMIHRTIEEKHAIVPGPPPPYDQDNEILLDIMSEEEWQEIEAAALTEEY